MGSLATYGFIVAYGLVSIALPSYLREQGVSPGAQSHSGWRFGDAAGAGRQSLPRPGRSVRKLPYIYLAYLTTGMLWLFLRRIVKQMKLCKTKPFIDLNE